jgi:hypothetical protein
MSISKSRLPKSERTARELAAEPLPDPRDYFGSAAYIDRRAELGDFNAKGTPAAVLPVLHYLLRHTVRSSDNRKLGPNERVGWVLRGKSKIGKIAAELAISYNSANRALQWLTDRDWLAPVEAGQTYLFRVRLDAEGHKLRTERAAGSTSGAQTVTCEGTAVTCEGTAPSPERGETVTCEGRQYKDFDLGLDLDVVQRRQGAGKPTQDQGQDQNQDAGQGESPAAQRAWLESVRSGAQRPAARAERAQDEADPERAEREARAEQRARRAALRAEEDARNKEREAARDAAWRDQQALITSAADRLRDMVRSAGKVLETEARAELGLEDTGVWKGAWATLMGLGEIKLGYEMGVGQTLTWIGRAA